MLAVILSIVFLSTVWLATALYGAVIQWSSRIKLNRYLSEPIQEKNRVKLPKTNFKEAFYILGKQLIGLLALGRYREKIDKRLEKADVPLNAEEAMVALLFAVLIAFLIALKLSGSIIFAVLASVLVFLLLKSYLKMQEKKRLNKITSQLADALDMISGSLRAGYSFLRSMEVVSNEMQPPISNEFGKVVKEIGLGVPVENALESLLKRLPSEDIEMMVTALVIQRQTGGNLAEIIDNIADTIRERFALKREVTTVTAQGRISGWIIGFLPVGVGLIISVLDPGYMRILFTSKLGIAMITIAAINEIIGMLVIRKVLDVRY